MYRWYCLYHCTAGSSTSLMEIRSYDPRSKEPLLYNLSYLVVLKFGLETVFSINIMNLWCVAHYTWLLMRQYPSLVSIMMCLGRNTEAWFPKMTSVSVSHHVLPAEWNHIRGKVSKYSDGFPFDRYSLSWIICLLGNGATSIRGSIKWIAWMGNMKWVFLRDLY